MSATTRTIHVKRETGEPAALFLLSEEEIDVVIDCFNEVLEDLRRDPDDEDLEDIEFYMSHKKRWIRRGKDLRRSLREMHENQGA